MYGNKNERMLHSIRLQTLRNIFSLYLTYNQPLAVFNMHSRSDKTFCAL